MHHRVAPHAAHPGILVTGERVATATAKLSLCHKVSRKKGGSHGEMLARGREIKRGREIGKREVRKREEEGGRAWTFKFMVMLGRRVIDLGSRSLSFSFSLVHGLTAVIY